MSLLSIGVSGLDVSQTLLKVTGNNIVNANNPAYSRQRADLGTIPEQFVGVGYLGSGATVQDIDRVVDQFLINQIYLDSSAYNNLNSFTRNIEQIDSLLAGEASGLGPGINGFFSAIETAAQDPTSMPARQLVLSNSEGLVERFNTLYDRVLQQNLAVNDQLSALTDQITSLAEGIANLNADISEQLARGVGSQPNSSLDDRDELIRKLSELISVQVTEDNSGMANVFIGSGQNLVVGTRANTIGVEASTRDPGDVEITFTSMGGVTQAITDFMTGGKVGGLLDFRHEVIDLGLNSMGRIAISLATTINEQNQKGVDLEGNLGGLIFKDISSVPQVIPNSANDVATPTTVIATISDISQLTTSDYALSFSSATDYSIFRESDGSVITGTLGALPETVTIDGLDITISGAPDDGDRFSIRPTRFGANTIAVDIRRSQELAFASPILTNADIGNTGTGIIFPGEVVDVFNGSGAYVAEFATPGQLSPPILLRFSSATNYDVINSATGVTIAAANAFIPGIVNTITFGSPTAYQIEIDGAPDAGDEFTIDYNGTGISDNRNAVALGALRISGELEGGSLNFEDAYGRLLEQIGARTAQVQISRDAAESLLAQTQSNRDSVSGVSMEEEAANLIQFEQAYNASAQVINVARQIFDTLLSVF
ncbi:MAG: flagellar hook-associated protein 1 FlgK [Oceanicoccus sp.]|jgi:flagellar hook-associated protein 1 FlgK